jgi:membrane-associated protease RseP (regulator of RpoE activity)
MKVLLLFFLCRFLFLSLILYLNLTLNHVQLSLSVALVNVIPAYTLDGGLAFTQFVKMTGSRLVELVEINFKHTDDISF